MRRCFLVCAFAFLLAGCGVSVGQNSPPVEIEGTVTVDGKSVDGVILNLQVTGMGTPNALPVKNGTVKGNVTPGKYTYFLSEAKNAAAFKTVPQKYREGSMERQIVIKGPGPVDFAFDK